MSPNVPASVKARLLNGARARNEEFQRTLARYAAERLIYRIGASRVRNRFVLKGAGLLVVWLRDPHRATRDVDVLAFGASDEPAVRALVEEICAVSCPEDGLSFDAGRAAVEDIRGGEEYVGKRIRLIALLGTARIPLQVDIGFGDALALLAEEIVYPLLLDDLPAPRILAYPREASIAEKFHAIVLLDVQNSRMKDFHDIWAFAGAFAFEGAKLRFDDRRVLRTPEDTLDDGGAARADAGLLPVPRPGGSLAALPPGRHDPRSAPRAVRGRRREHHPIPWPGPRESGCRGCDLSELAGRRAVAMSKRRFSP
jgi:hypothetical protein